jgi:hypothetical protein
MMKKIVGKGEIGEEISLDKNIKTYIDFFCYFKTFPFLSWSAV